MKFLLCSLLNPPTSSSLLDTNILLSILFSDPLYLQYMFLASRDHVLYPYKTECKIIILCILIFDFLERRQEDERFP
jgi:hypothetical protein